MLEKHAHDTKQSVNSYAVELENIKAQIGLLGLTALFMFIFGILIPMFVWNHKEVLFNKEYATLVGTMRLDQNGGYIDADIKVSETAVYYVSVTIYSKKNEYLGSYTYRVYLLENEEETVYFYIRNKDLDIKPDRYDIHVYQEMNP